MGRKNKQKTHVRIEGDFELFTTVQCKKKESQGPDDLSVVCLNNAHLINIVGWECNSDKWDQKVGC